MGVAAYNRGSKAISRGYESDLASVKNTNDARAMMWRDLIEAGHVLTFRANSGHVFTVGQYHAAASEYPKFALLFCGRGNGVDEFCSMAWSVAVRIIAYAGRKRPISIS